MNGADIQRARRWFWTLTATAVLAMGTLSHGLHAPAGPHTSLLVGASTLILAASSVQAARTWLALAGPPRLRWHQGQGMGLRRPDPRQGRPALRRRHPDC